MACYSFNEEYITGDRFGAEFMERRRQEYASIIDLIIDLHSPFRRLERFLQRLSRHPTLQRATLVRSFFESKEWVCVIFL